MHALITPHGQTSKAARQTTFCSVALYLLAYIEITSTRSLENNFIWTKHELCNLTFQKRRPTDEVKEDFA
jgi:hypothetical protein